MYMSTENIHFLVDYRIIKITKIKPMYIPEITSVFLKKTNKTFQYLDTFDLLLPVEKPPKKDEYILVGRYDCYSFLKNDTDLKKALCIVEEFTDGTSQYLKILRRLHGKGDSTKLNKRNILHMLQSHKLSPAQISKMSGFKNHDFDSYHYSENIPKHYINNHTTEQTLNWIANLSLDTNVSKFLYESAGISKRDNKRLTNKKKKKLEFFFEHAKRFEDLSYTQQIKLLSRALNFKAVVMTCLQKEIDMYLE